ncbi:DUF1285 domain-containing protein [Asticcacaulis benevestitus]|uniref:Proteophosphoglycan n=1 Tax=Asticcacaulis benevestitus DSM 16100 = ATCC BAA-896 TaxID=1121022 RepID=V4RM14_9CAUL|nr:DUF1285 domain-containing protein [Asticcacaulis benevestitus]ESQ92313.1 hypothetical protein ABENE_09110 [Asticcacaulis benevestitus DSM 16100 = ATCC BAA-896]
MDLTRLYADAQAQGSLPPVERWHPPFCGDIDMRIASDGTWFYNGTPIERTAMVQLFARILRKEEDAYFLVTPVEKVGITVEDVPFIAVEMTASDGALTFRTSVGDVVTAGADHPLRFENDEDGFRPYIEVRHGLEARMSRGLAQDIAALGMVVDGWFGVRSSGVFYAIARVDKVFSKDEQT